MSRRQTRPSGGDVLLTRRHFLYGVAGVAAVAVVGGGAYAAVQAQSSADSDDVAPLEVPESAVFTTDDCAEIADPAEAFSLAASIELDYGSLIWSNDDHVAACLLPSDTTKPLAKVGLISLDAGTCTVVREHAVGEADGFEVYDVRACAAGIVWTEANILEGVWRVYHAALDGTSVGEPVLAEEGGADWETPTLAAAGAYAFWQMLPRLDGRAKAEDSRLRCAAFGSSAAQDAYVSHGRMACAPSADADSVTITPRADTSGTYYQLTRIDAQTASVTDALVLPASMKPVEASWGETGFSFAFESIYNYGGGIANLGTYVPAEAAGSNLRGESAAHAYGAKSWFRFPRTPFTAPAWCGSWFMVKSSSAVCGVDLAGRRYVMLDVENGADDYGDYLASTGTGTTVVTYSNIDHTALDGEQTRHCLVRIWKAL